jgi:hypothetical protein
MTWRRPVGLTEAITAARAAITQRSGEHSVDRQGDNRMPDPATVGSAFSDRPAVSRGDLTAQPTCATFRCMAYPAPPVIRDVLDHAWDLAQRLAIEVIEYPANKRNQVMQCMGSLLVEVARQAGCPHEAAREFCYAMEQTIRGYVSEIEASGGGTVGTA